MTKSELAEIFSVTERTMTNYVNRGMPVEMDGSYDLRECVAWYFAENADQHQLDRERARLARAQADRTEAANAERASELMETTQAGAEVGEMLADFRDRLAQLPAALSRVIDPKYRKRLGPAVRDHVNHAIAELKEYRP